MNIVLLGDDRRLLQLLRAMIGDAKLKLTHYCGVEESLAGLMQLAPGARRVTEWEEFLQLDAIDLLLIAGTDETTQIAAKQLASSGVPLAILPAAGLGITFIYELSLIRDDNALPIIPLFTKHADLAVQQLQTAIAQHQLGRIQHLQIERTAIPHAADSSRLTAKEIESALLSDVALIRHLCGDYNQVTALYSGSNEQGHSLATVTLAAENLPEVTCTIRPAVDVPCWKLTLTSDSGVIVLRQQEEGTPLILETGGEINFKLFDEPASVEKNYLLHAMQTALQDQQVCNRICQELVHTFETVEATRRSIKRRRTIDLYFETTSERSLFKSQMTAIGCSLLMVTLFLFVLVLLLGSLFTVNSTIMQILRALVFLPLFIFLGMQLLLFITRPATEVTTDQKQIE